MMKIRKDYNLKSISLVVAIVFILTNACYGVSLPDKTKLRVPAGSQGTYNRMEDCMELASNEEQEKTASSDKKEPSFDFSSFTLQGQISSNTTIAQSSGSNGKSLYTRRQFLKISAYTAAALSFLTNMVEDETHFGYSSFPLDMEYLNKLPKKEAKEYFIKLDQLIKDKSLSRVDVDRFLRHVFKESDIVWIRAEAIKLLFRHKFVGFREAKDILTATPDTKVVFSIYEALAEDPTEEIIFFLRDRIKKEPRGYISQNAFYKSLKNADLIPEEIAADILKASQQHNFFAYQYMDNKGLWTESLGILSRKNPEAHRMLLYYAKNIKDQSNKYSLFHTLAEAGTPEAESLLIQISRDASEMKQNAWGIISGLRILNTPASKKRLLELSYEIDNYHNSLGAMIFALVKSGTPEAARRLVELTGEYKNNEEELAGFGYNLGEIHYPEVEERVLELSHDRREAVRKIMAYALADLGTEKAEQRLLDWSRDTQETRMVRHFIIDSLGKIGTTAARARLMELYEEALAEEDFDMIDYEILKALRQYDTKETLDWLFSRLTAVQNSRVRKELNNTIFGMAGFKSLELLRAKLIQAPAQEKESIRTAIEGAIEGISSGFLDILNNEVERDIPEGERQIAIFTDRLRNYPEVLYLIVALSKETTSHSFPPMHEHFKKYLERMYGRSDSVRYIKEQFGNNFISEYLFSLTIFGELENAFVDAGYDPKYLANLILSAGNIRTFFQKPGLFAKIVVNITEFQDRKFKNPFIDKMLELAKEREEFVLFIKLLVEFGFIDKVDSRIKNLIDGVKLPLVDSVWKGPQVDWIDKDGALRVGLYWSTKNEGEQNHYYQFPEIFSNGKGVDDFYKNFSGYEDRSSDKYYEEKIKKYGAEKVLVKEFPVTGRRIEIYLYSSYEKIKDSPYPITISRGHAGEEGNTDYPGINGGIRVASHCRSIDDTDSLIKANARNATVAIIGTARARETNPVLYYLFEYLGTYEKWGDLNTVKDFIRPHTLKSIQKYNFPTDDVSFLFAVILQHIKEMEKSDSFAIPFIIQGAMLQRIINQGSHRVGLDSGI